MKKKITLIFFTVLLLMPAALTAPAGAQGVDTEEYKAAFERCLIEQYGYSQEAIDAYGGQFPFSYYGEINGYAVCFAALEPTPMEMTAQIGRYKFFNRSLYTPDQLGIFLIQGQEAVPLWKAYQMGIVTNIKDIAEMFPVQNGYGLEARPLGDTDLDGALMLTDVLTMQKVLAQIIKLENLYSGSENEFYVRELCDLNRDGKLTVADVLLAQRILAGERLPWAWLPIQEA